MALVFQYGSNMSVARLNHADRLSGDARVSCVAQTVEPFEFEFGVWSKTNNCAAATIVPSESGRHIFGVVYEIPEFLLSRDTAKTRGRKSLDAIEGEGTNYTRQQVELKRLDGSQFSALTYVVRDRTPGVKTSTKYVQHIVTGLLEHNIPQEYRRYVAQQVVANNSALEKTVRAIFG
jgi:hypothetical protein